MLIAALLLGFVSQEPLGVSLAATFYITSWMAIGLLISLTANNLMGTIRNAMRERQIGILSQRYRWVYLDGLIVVWVLITIAISNFVLENSIANAGFLVGYGWIACPLLAVGYGLFRRTE